MSEISEIQPPRRIKLRRETHGDIIQQNLKNIEFNALPKRIAQQFYYNNVRENFQNPSRLPVHLRLGRRLRRGKFFYPTNNNNFAILNKSKRIIRLRGLQQHSVQSRLLRIKESVTGFTPKRIKLIRQNSNNYTFSVNNQMASMLPQVDFRHSCLADLNKKLQEEIRYIQIESKNAPEVIPPLPIHVEGYGVSNISLHIRFSV